MTPNEEAIHKLLDDWASKPGVFHAMPEQPTLRDQFAMAALTGIISANDSSMTRGLTVSVAAYQVADAMLAERAKK